MAKFSFGYVLKGILKLAEWWYGLDACNPEEKDDSIEWLTIGDDLESWLSDIQNNAIDQYTYKYLKTHKMLQSQDSNRVKMQDENFLEQLHESLLLSDVPIFDENDRLYIIEQCTRYSWIVKNSFNKT